MVSWNKTYNTAEEFGQVRLINSFIEVREQFQTAKLWTYSIIYVQLNPLQLHRNLHQHFIFINISSYHENNKLISSKWWVYKDNILIFYNIGLLLGAVGSNIFRAPMLERFSDPDLPFCNKDMQKFAVNFNLHPELW